MQSATIYSDDEIIRNLPHDSPRRGQVAAIRFALESWDSGKRVVVLEAPTGAGKSGIGLAISNFHHNCYYLTVQKILQAQIIRDYERINMVELKGRNAYPCTFYNLHASKLQQLKLIDKRTIEAGTGSDCSVGYCKKHLQEHKCHHCFPPRNASDDKIESFLAQYGVMFSTCPYYEQVEKAIRARKVLMNFSSFLFQTQFTPRFHPRELLIIDEAHQCEPQLMDFVTLTINDLQLRNRGIRLPDFDEPEQYAIWFHDNNMESEIGRMIKEAHCDGDIKAEDEYTRLYRKYMHFMRCIADGMADWVCEYKEHNLSKNNQFSTVTIKPVFVSPFANDLLFKYGKRILLMSATILDAGVMAQSLGLNKNEIAFFRMNNYFPKENRPIYIDAAAKIVGGKDKMHTWSKQLVQKVDDIVSRYTKERGIIHTHNYAIAELLMSSCRSKSRFLFQRNFKDKDAMLAEHARRSDSVIVAPAMHEGLDLRDDLSRFQIIAKVPYPNFFDDKQLARRVEIDQRYLTWLVALKLVQSYGRSVRSDKDWAHTYIIDAAIERFLTEADRILPSWFKEAIVRGNKKPK